MYEVSLVNNLSEFLDYNQIVSLLQDQMNYIGAPKSPEEIMRTIKMAFENDCSKLMVLSESGHVIGFAFFNICVGMESAGRYLWLNEMHVHKNYRSKGYGAILYSEMIKWCKEHNIKRIMGMADESEERTINFYRKQGADIYTQQIISMKLTE